MNSFILRAAAAAVLTVVPLLADFTYDETSQVTGGAVLQMARMVGAFSKGSRKLTEPIQTTVAIKENRMVRKTADEVTITDLDQQTITRIHPADKTYSVIYFRTTEAADECHG
jgi:hypothetical protein